MNTVEAREQGSDFWESASYDENIALLQKISRLKTRGFNVDGLVSAIETFVRGGGDREK